MSTERPPLAAEVGAERERADSRNQVAASFQVAIPEPFCFSRPEEWEKWSRRFERFRIASGLTLREDEVQVSTLIYAMGDQADDILHSFALSEENRKSYQMVKSKFDDHFVKRRNVIFERAKFNRQEGGESVDTFITALYSLAEHCGYSELHDEMIRDRIVVGIRNSALSEKLQLDPRLTLDSAISQVRQSEAIKQQQTLLRGGKPDTPVGAVHKGRGGPRAYRGSGSYNTPTSHKQPQDVCPWCGRRPAHSKAQCPAKDQLCNNCHKRGHYKSVCRSTAKVGGIGASSEEEKTVFLGAVTHNTKDDPWAVEMLLQGKPATLHIDTGAEVTVVTEKVWESLGQPQLELSDRTLRGPDNRAIPTLGKFTGTFTLGDRQVKSEAYVARGLTKSLLGRPAIQLLELIKRIATIDETTGFSPRDEFPTLFTGLGKLKGEYTIELRDDAQPFSLSIPRRVAIPLLKSVQQELDRMERNGVIAKVKQPTEWCCGMVVVPKSNSNKVRICVDLTRLNHSVKRERHPLPAVDQTLAQLAGGKVFSKLDANSGFWQIPLSPASALLTTFITPFGRYHFRRLPFGISSAPEHFQRRISEALIGLEGTVCLMDDILVYGATREEHDERLREVLQRLRDLGMTLNPEKCSFAKSSVKFLGHMIDSEGIKPDPDKVSAIEKFTTPSCIGDVRRFLGMINQLSKFSPHLSDMTKPIRELLVKENAWVWGQPQRDAMTKVKEAIAASPILAKFDPNLETVVSADASSHGLGAVLLQKQDSGELQPVAFISRSMTPTEKRYAQIEKEALAFTWACERLSDYLVGLQFHIQTDHKPLVPLFSTKHLEELPLRVQRFRMRMMRFLFTISHVPGKDLKIADTLSRAPVADPTAEDAFLQQEVTAYVDFVIGHLPATEQRLEEIRACQEADKTCQQIAEFCQAGWPEKSMLPVEVKPYYSVSAELTVQKGLLLRGSRIVIPPPLRKTLLEKIHSGHQGITKCRERARQSIWWPGISTQLENLVRNCKECLKSQQNRPQPLSPTPLPALPWQRVGSDLFEWKQSVYLLVVDYYSRFIEIARLNRSTTAEVVTHLKSIFARHGIPETLISDNGPQYSSREFSEFAAEYEFRHVTASPYHPQGNGEAERAVGTVKSLLKKGDDPYKALLAYRSTPLQLGYSPAELLMGRVLRTTVPTTIAQRKPKIPNLTSVRAKDKKSKARQKQDFDSHHGARELPLLQPGDQVWVSGRETEAEVQGEVAPQSYVVETEDGTFRRNRQQLVRLPNSETENTSGSHDRAETTEPIEESTSNESSESIVPPLIRRSTRHSRPPERLDPSWSN